MIRNPWSPPGAPVVDQEVPILAAPWQVKVAVWLVWFSLATSAIAAAFEPITLGIEDGIEETLVMLIWVLAGLTIGLMALLSFFILRAHRWARIVYSAIAVFSLIGVIDGVPASFAQSWYSGMLYILTTATDVMSIVLLFTPPANIWFRLRHAPARA